MKRLYIFSGLILCVSLLSGCSEKATLAGWYLETAIKRHIPDIPKETVTVLKELGYTFDLHNHASAESPQTIENPVSGYCGNTITSVYVDDEEYAFWGNDSVTLTDILINLAYDPDQICRCLPEYTVDTEFGDGYGVNLSESYVRCTDGQASLTAEQVKAIREIIARNCTN